MLRGQISSTKYSPTWEKISAKEVKEQVENGRRAEPQPPGVASKPGEPRLGDLGTRSSDLAGGKRRRGPSQAGSRE
ncbi:hypothetical protein PoB_007415800 [Plakobranchus ocellatus]|uniref:Uncharacterized protein n=1 Tax=Plakobranchus ocellatus TaxID=259542 RepID=A0AAV4DTJ4_9GAST|nr:hypothetical protein PoB_007415800 [Plakobranchus ocellatus]